MTPQEFSSAGGKAMKGTPQAKERARKGGLAAAAKRKLEGETLADRSAYVASKEAQGKARLVEGDHEKDARLKQERLASEMDREWLYDEPETDSRVEYDKKQKWQPTPDEIP